MPLLSTLSTTLLSLEHLYILYLEMFLWDTPTGRKAFRMTPEQSSQTKVLAANQGLYNGFLAAGLAWAAAHPVQEFAWQLRVFFLGCVVVAGAYGGATASRKIWRVQMAPGVVALGVALAGL
jgi:putative membrane protein